MINTKETMNLIDALKWRYATKRMTGEAVPKEKVDSILEATSLSASSMGLQPYSILVVENKEVRKKIQSAAHNQPQIVESSHLIVFAAWDDITEEQVGEYIRNIAKTREVPVDTLQGFKDKLTAFVKGKTVQQRHEWAARQAYIAFGTAITAAALERVDATPMEGFDPEAVDQILNLKEKGLRSVTILALGYRDKEKDHMVNQKKVRRAKHDLILQLN